MLDQDDEADVEVLYSVTCALPDLRYMFYAAVGALTVACALWLALLQRR